MGGNASQRFATYPALRGFHSLVLQDFQRDRESKFYFISVFFKAGMFTISTEALICVAFACIVVARGTIFTL